MMKAAFLPPAVARASLLLAVVALAACIPAEAGLEAEVQVLEVSAAPGARVEVAVVQSTEARLVLELPGEVEGAREASLSAALGGYVERVLVDEGDEVKAGQLLAEVDTSLRALAVESERAQLAQADEELARIDKLGNLATPSELTQARTRAKLADVSFSSSKIQLARTRIRAPFSGVIAKRDLEIGEVTGPNATAFRLIQLDPAIVNLSVSDRDVVALEEGMQITIMADARLEPLRGVLTRVLPAGNLKTRTFEVEVEVPNPDHTLLPGMIASANVSEVVATEAIVLPQDFLVTRVDGLGVYVDEGGTAVWRPITVGSIVGDQAVIASGVSAGDRVVVVGHRELVDGDTLILAREGTCCTSGRATF